MDDDDDDDDDDDGGCVWSCLLCGDYGAQHEMVEALVDLATSKRSPWLQHADWSTDAQSLRELAIKTPWMLNDSFIWNHFKSLNLLDKCVSKCPLCSHNLVCSLSVTFFSKLCLPLSLSWLLFISLTVCKILGFPKQHLSITVTGFVTVSMACCHKAVMTIGFVTVWMACGHNAVMTVGFLTVSMACCHKAVMTVVSFQLHVLKYLFAHH